MLANAQSLLPRRRPGAFAPAARGRASASRSAQLPWRRAAVRPKHARCQAAPDGGSHPPGLSATPEAQALGSSLPTASSDFPGGGSSARPRVSSGGTTEQHAEVIDWDAWSSFFDDMDEAGARVREVHLELQAAVQAEDYAAAASLKQELDGLLSKDAVAGVLKELESSLEAEQYARAAQLRDEGGAGLLGWWCGRGSEDDPYGHLLHVTPDFGRYVGTAYQAKDLAELKGWTEESFLRGSLSSRQPRQLSELGTPVMELFLQRSPDGEGFERQVVALSPAEELTVSLSEGDLVTDGGEDIAVEHGEDEGGSYVKISLGFPQDGPIGPSGSSPSGRSGRGFSGLADPQDPSLQEEDEDESTPYDAVSYEEDLLAAAGSLFPLSGGSSGAEGVGEQEVEFFMTRHQAALHLSNRDAFEFEVMGLEAPAASSSTAVRIDGDNGGDAEVRIVYEVEEEEGGEEGTESSAGPSGHGDGPGLGDSDDEPAGFRSTLVKFAQESAKLANGGASTSGAAEAGADAEASSSGRQQQQGGDAEDGGKGSKGSSADNGNQRPPRDRQIEEVRRLARELIGASASAASSAGGASTFALRDVGMGGAMGPAAALLAGAPGGKVRYQRLTPTGVRTDPLTGLYLGAFGPHGPELLQLSRGTWQDGEEMVYGVKVTGDPNVPAGSLSFRAKIGRRNRLDPSEEYPPELGVVARYKGEGRIAATGYRNPRWVEGELLQFSSGTPVTRGAQLGFVWSIPGEKKFLILLSRVDLGQF